MKHLPLIFMGTPEFSCPTLRALVEAKHHIVAIFTQPPRPSGRGFTVIPSPIHHYAKKLSIPVFTPTSLKSSEEYLKVLDLIKRYNVQGVIVVAYGLILPAEILKATPFGCLNVHASLLPRWRGASPIQRAIEAGDNTTGITIMQMNEGLDTGPMLMKKSIPVEACDTSQSLHEKLSSLGGPLLLQTLEGLVQGTLQPEPQPLFGITYAPKVLKEDGHLNFKESAFTLERKIRAFTPWPGTYFIYQNLKIKVLEASIETASPSDKITTAGHVISIAPLQILCGNHTLLCPLKLQRPGGNILNTPDFLRGFPIPLGTSLLST